MRYYSISDIVSIRDQDESWKKREKVVVVWKRKAVEKIVYDCRQIYEANEDDMAWVITREIAKVHMRKTFSKSCTS